MQTIRAEMGKRIRELRKTRGWSQEKLGELADLHPTYIGGIERGERNVAFENLVRLADAFKLTLSQFMDFQRKGGQSRRDVLKANIIVSLQKRSEGELQLISAIIGNIDEWQATAKKP
jgi:transcriptional regulator with XRE-family HTH domain